MKFYTIEIFRAQQQRKDGKEANFFNFGRERREFPALRLSTQQNLWPEAQIRNRRQNFVLFRPTPSTQKVLTFESFVLFYHFHCILPQNKFLK